MGMFDYITVSDSLPYTEEMINLGLVNTTRPFQNFQTKDIDCKMALFTIKDGELLEQKFETQTWVEGDKNPKSFLDAIGYMKRENPYWEKRSFHGEIYFYDYIQDVQSKWDCWVEFKAVFTNNKVERYELVEFKKQDNSERVAREEEWRRNLEERNNKWINKYFFHTKFYSWCSLQYRRVLTKLINLLYKIRGY